MHDASDLSSKKSIFAPRLSHGFTIVELLIVIVVIAILAAITIVAYSGISSRAAVSANAAGLSQVNQKLAAYAVEFSAYPSDLLTVGVKDGNTSYQYTYSNTAPISFCVTATTGSISHYISSTNTVPASGSCVGQSNGGAPLITNYSNNPSLEGSTTSGYSVATWGTSGAGTASQDLTLANTGTKSYKMLWSTASTGAAGAGAGTPAMPVTAGNVYTFSIYVRSTIATIVSPTVRSYTSLNGGGSLLDTAGTTVSVPANTWTRVSNTITIPSGYLSAGFRLGFSGAYGIGDSVNIDSNMITDGSTLYNYADGLTPGWNWQSGINTSPSSGYAV